ncbi:MAG TPA: hypothetical protein VGR94_09085 [Candidatus Acidoferrales bacterium]|nr:hypothetical protein [Candidatus Acidoferrales bacterium]
MKKNFAVICFFLLVPSPVLPQAANTKQRTLALTHVTVIDTTGGPVQSDVTVVIRGQRIIAMGKSGKVRVSVGSRIVNATGRFLIPGLWDMDVYWYDPKEYLPLFIANGVTGVQEALGYADHHEIQEEVDAGRLLAPRMVVGTRWVSGPMPSDPDSKAEILVANEAEARRAVIDAKNYGADFIEVSGIENVPREAFFALADEAKKRGISLQGDVPVFVSLEEASNAGREGARGEEFQEVAATGSFVSVCDGQAEAVEFSLRNFP